MMIGQGGFQADDLEIGQVCMYNEDGGNCKVRIKSKEVKSNYMYLTLTIVEVLNQPTIHNRQFPAIGNDLIVTEYRGAGTYAGWTIM